MGDFIFGSSPKELIYRDCHKYVPNESHSSRGLHICNVTKSFPKDEIYGLASQIRRSAVSLPGGVIGVLSFVYSIPMENS